jgi:FkbM family methyltransferase
VDCGAYTGDTLLALASSGVAFSRVAAFEPDPPNYAKLREAASALDAALFPCGVWDRMAQLRFSSDGSAGHLTPEGSVVVQVVSLDEALPTFRPDFLKMDIEGAEPRALDGARGMIARSRPRLAVSTYHAPEHLFSLLLQVEAWDLGYRYALRSHAHNSFETVLYAIP